MILILSETYDTVTDTVCSWLNLYHKKFVRINQDESHSIQRIEMNNDNLDVVIKDRFNKTSHHLNDFTSLWNRRGFFRVASVPNKYITAAESTKTLTPLSSITSSLELTSFVYSIT